MGDTLVLQCLTLGSRGSVEPRLVFPKGITIPWHYTLQWKKLYNVTVGVTGGADDDLDEGFVFRIYFLSLIADWFLLRKGYGPVGYLGDGSHPEGKHRIERVDLGIACTMYYVQ